MRLPELRRHADELGFTPQEPVRWLSPGQLAGTAVKVVLATVFAGYSDKREIQAALHTDELEVTGTADELWIDFVADLGDGFDATATVAHTVAAETVTVTGSAGLRHQLSRGGVLILGGDEVYPTASAVSYEDRFKGPYRAALPSSEDEPLLVALPGNHDWYDGLTSFLRLFTQRHPIGGWRTGQTRSYFAVQLPQRWWLVGLDSQLGSYIDEPQLEYFRNRLWPNLKNGDAVIVCSAVPTWVRAGEGHVNDFTPLHWFDRNVIRNKTDRATGEQTPTGASIRVWLTGDRHHYARYAELLPGEQIEPGTSPPPDEQRSQLVTCGLGGAYLAATDRLPTQLQLPPAAARMRSKDEPRTFVRAGTVYPDASTSRSLAERLARPWSPYWLARRNHGFPQLAGGIHAVLFVFWSVLFGWAEGMGPIEAVRSAGFGDLLRFLGIIGLVGLVVLLIGWLQGRRRGKKARAAPSSPPVAGLLQVGVAFVILAVAVAVPWPSGWPAWLILMLCLGIAAALGAGLGSQAFALAIVWAGSGQMAEWQMAGQSIEDYKGFLRLHIAPAGNLTIYPLAIDQVCHDWGLAGDRPGEKRPVPAVPLASPRLIEDPVVVARKGNAP